MTNTTTTPNLTLDIDNARDIVIHIYRALPDTADYFESGDCWAVENEGVRVFFGVDPHDGEGICWAAWNKEEDGRETYWDAYGLVGGWAFGDRQIASAEIAEIIKVMGGA